MNIRPVTWTAPLLLTTLCLSACGERHEVRRGPVITENREVGKFEAISLRGSAELRIEIGGTEFVSIEGHERTVKQLSTEIEDDTLYIRNSRKDWMFSTGNSRPVIKITVPKLTELRLEGGNQVTLNGFDGGHSTFEIEGAASVTASGRLDELTVHMQGAGQANLRNLVAGKAKVTVDGVASVQVHSTESLDATMNGVGAILYSGTPRNVNTSMNGIGTISRDRDRNNAGDVDADADTGADTDTNSDDDADSETKVPVDPETLQPEYEKKKVKVELTGVI